MSLYEQIEKIKTGLREGTFISEATVSQGVLLPALHRLGWNIFDTSIVVPEYRVGEGCVDFALCHPASRPAVFIKVKRVGSSEGADCQLFEYAFHQGVPIAVLTDGQEWSFYLPAEQGRYDERRVYKLDLLERTTGEAKERLNRYLSYERICSGEALEATRSDYQDVAHSREMERTFPKAWKSLLEEPDSLLPELLAKKVEDLCGYKPDFDVCSEFLESIRSGPPPGDTLFEQRSHQPLRPSLSGAADLNNRRPQKIGKFIFKGTAYKADSAKDVMIRIFQLLAQEDSRFLERFASRRLGRINRYLARNKNDLYPNTPDLARTDSFEIREWWLATKNHGLG